MSAGSKNLGSKSLASKSLGSKSLGSKRVDFEGLDRQRIDKWLWHARMVRTRSDAAGLATAGFVRINGKRMTAASHLVRIGDVVTLALDRSVRVVRVEGICQGRGDASAARMLYRDLG